MADKTPPELGALATLADADLLLVWSIADAVLRKMEASVLINLILAEAGGTYLEVANNLSDLANAVAARSNLGLGDAATKSVGTAAGTVAAGNDGRFTSIPGTHTADKHAATGATFLSGNGGDAAFGLVGSTIILFFSVAGNLFMRSNLGSGKLDYVVGGFPKFSVNGSGDLVVSGDITAFGSP